MMKLDRSVCFALVASCSLLLSAAAQSDEHPFVPRLSDGKPNFNGVWQAVGGADVNLLDHIADKYAPGAQKVIEETAIPYLPEAVKRRQENFERRATDDPETSKCYLPGVPRITYAHNLPFQIFQKPDGDKITVLYEFAEAHRFLYTNGTDHPPGHINWWLGDSRARWEGDTLVVDSVDFNDATWFDHAGDYHSDALHVIEHYQLLDADHIDYRVEIEDPKVYSTRWHIDLILYRRKEKNFQLLDYVCYGFDLGKYYP
ncbi:hypothetical protein ACPOL_2561 [Acidisarcina polymorpha]|uniref:Secreted protein n=1 Tax=Acidisarcina polymorpha TaxID=2211140 RepID=A0A2Z5FYE0_9BACT|nr:hypothetical protein [Acidisarcina polymorpha]AXC11881.1 hypothetical protein ACPOL_2561 [Acidisarcina polymorpha]